MVRQGKTLYIGLSNYRREELKKASAMLKELKTPCLVTQPRYSLLDRWTEEDGLFDFLREEGIGSIVFSPLAQGLLTQRYLNGIPSDSRAGGGSIFLRKHQITEEMIEHLRQLNEMALARKQTLAQMALAWVLRRQEVTSALIGASRPDQILDSVKALDNPTFTEEELERIDGISGGIIVPDRG